MNAFEWTRRNLHPERHEERPVVLTKFSRHKLAKLFGLLDYKRGAEIGVADGRFSRVICDYNPEVHLLCVDTWQVYRGNRRGGPQEQHDRNLRNAKRILEPFDCGIIQAFSMEAAHAVPMESLDFVYIDANHGFDYVMQDIIEWSRRVVRGGIVAGHDYYHFRGAGVVEAVDAYVLAHSITDWYLTNESKEKSWFWVKK